MPDVMEQLTERLGLVVVQGTRYRDKDWREVVLWRVVGSEELWHVEQFAPSWLDYKPSHGSHALMRDIVRIARELGFDGFLCDNNPKHGGMVGGPKED